ncbi:EAL domain-containing protein [Sphaerochaeta halotolerans]|uniref:EAL domain-containing protein n=1 Tax=Sphaerochaeta halotolerans TaxID=2293840 RepID=UPI00136D6317|nr:EAL domain-containing protein [Sphaerochaeta halotolerans]MXI86008.1 EAL domain-containing protein [Sphaerochaeta halotolerans]
MRIMQRHCIAFGSSFFLALLVSLFYAKFVVSIFFTLLLLISMSIGFLVSGKTEPWEYTGRSLTRWLRNNQANLDSSFCLYVSIHARGIFQSCVDRQELEEVYNRCAKELMGYFGVANVQRMTYDEFAVLRDFPTSTVVDEKEKVEYQTIVCQTITDRINGMLGSMDTSRLPPFAVTVGCASSGLRYRMNTLEQLVDLAYATEEAAKKSRKKFLVADEMIRARKLDIDECKQGFLTDGWEEEFNPFFQPIIDSVSFSVVGVESLARWQLGGFRVLSAQVFKDVACELHHITTIDLTIIAKTFSIIRRLMLARIIPYTFKTVINVSDESLKKGFAKRMFFLSEQHGLHPSQVEFDIKDSALAFPESLLVIKELREIGFRVSLDVFTETAFDLQALVRADFDIIKLDFRVFSPQLQQVYAALKEAAEKGGVEILAKGIENKTVLDAAISLGCTYVQGNYFTQPIPESTFEVFMKKYQQGLYLDSSLG